MNGRVRLRQPARGYRAAIDPVLLAAAVPAVRGERVLDIGCGFGAASLCLAARVADAAIIGLEREEDLARLARENAALNGCAARFTVVTGDLLDPPAALVPGSFRHVLANPPFLEAGTVTPPPDPVKALANIESEADFAAWLRFALAMVEPRGTVTFIHRADRIERLLTPLAEAAGEIVIFPLWPGEGKPARRILLRARKSLRTPTRLAYGLVLHEADGRYTAAAEAILRGGAALIL